MSALSLRLPESLHRQIRELAEREGISINQLRATAAAEKMAAVLTEEYLRQRARRGSRAKFKAVLAKLPKGQPAKGDEWTLRESPLRVRGRARRRG